MSTHRLVELAVQDLGIIEQLSLVFESGMTALTGETGAGKTMIVSAIDLLLGGRADPGLVRTGATEAIVQGRFEDPDGEELVLERIVPADGRSRAYVNGRMITASGLAELAGRFIDLHGQHAHQLLLGTASQRQALDHFGGIDLTPLEAVRHRRAEIEAALADMGGDAGSREREADLLRFQLEELDHASLDDPDEDGRLDEEENVLGAATDLRAAAARSSAHLLDDGGVVDGLASVLADLGDHGPFDTVTTRLRDLHAELADAAAEIRDTGEQIVDDPERLEAIRERRHLLVELRRKYGTAPLDGDRSGTGTLDDVIAYRDAVQTRLTALEQHDQRAAELERTLRDIRAEETSIAARIGAARRDTAAPLAAAITQQLTTLAMPDAIVDITIGDDDPGDDVTFLLAANPGIEPAPLARIASGGELARTMLALRLVLSTEPSITVFDEVDAGIGGAAARTVGRALAQLSTRHQVLVVTHLPQVAAAADQQIHIRKSSDGGTTRMRAVHLDDDARITEIARMLAGDPDSDQVRLAARELLDGVREAVRP